MLSTFGGQGTQAMEVEVKGRNYLGCSLSVSGHEEERCKDAPRVAAAPRLKTDSEDREGASHLPNVRRVLSQ